MAKETKKKNPEERKDDLPFAKKLFDAADQLRGSVESAEYKHLVLGLIFVKYISDSFERRRSELEQATRDPKHDLYTEDEEERKEILEDRDEYIAENVFWIPEKARWPKLQAAASQKDIGVRIDKALELIERDNPEQLRGVLDRRYAKAPIDPATLGNLLDTVSQIGFGDDPGKARDILGRTYEYFIKMFAKAEGHRGGEFYTAAPIVQLIVEMLEPYDGRVMDPACGSGGLFVQSKKFVKAHGGQPREISVLGQENNHATWRICKMNLAVHGFAGDIQLGDSLLDDKFPGARADYVMANPPFNMKKWGADRVAGDPRWAYGEPPNSNANYAWIQHFIHHLAPDGRAGFVMANGSLTGRSSGEGEIRERIIRDDIVDCIVACPNQLFYTTQIPVCLWFIDRNKASSEERDRHGETLFIDARKLGHMISRTQIDFSPEDTSKIATTYHAWRGELDETYEDVPGFCKSAALEEVEKHGFVLTPGRYVGVEDVEDEDEPFEEKMERLIAQLSDELEKSQQLESDVKAALNQIGMKL